ncbi:hypothetical protein Droror1_Dr00017622 [Drosera rotundifolia]
MNVSGPNRVDISDMNCFPSVVLFVGALDPLRDWELRYCQWLKRVEGLAVEVLSVVEADGSATLLAIKSLPQTRARNVSGPNAVDISGLNFLFVMMLVGRLDPLRDWKLRYRERFERMGKVFVLADVANWSHGFYLLPEVPESEMVMAEWPRSRCFWTNNV